MTYVCTINLPGYMPDHDLLTKFDTRAEAVDARLDSLYIWLEDMRDSYDEDSTVIGDYLEAIHDKHDDDVIRVPLSDSPHDLGVVFEIIEIEEQA